MEILGCPPPDPTMIYKGLTATGHGVQRAQARWADQPRAPSGATIGRGSFASNPGSTIVLRPRPRRISRARVYALAGCSAASRNCTSANDSVTAWRRPRFQAKNCDAGDPGLGRTPLHCIRSHPGPQPSASTSPPLPVCAPAYPNCEPSRGRPQDRIHPTSRADSILRMLQNEDN
jgi:hypothetical protein